MACILILKRVFNRRRHQQKAPFVAFNEIVGETNS